jgi:carbohydrate-binding DOMON domain-containing protein
MQLANISIYLHYGFIKQIIGIYLKKKINVQTYSDNIFQLIEHQPWHFQSFLHISAWTTYIINILLCEAGNKKDIKLLMELGLVATSSHYNNIDNTGKIRWQYML